MEHSHEDSLEYSVWDNPEVLHLRSERSRGDVVYTVSHALRGELTRQERASSGGGYTGADVAWTIPAVLLPEGFEPKPADVGTDENDVEYTVLTATGIGYSGRGRHRYAFWRLTTRALAIAYDLRDLVDVERPKISYDAAGAMVKGWPPNGGGKNLYTGLRAKVQLVSRDETTAWGMKALKGTHTVHVSRPIPLVSLEDRIAWQPHGSSETKYLEIKGIKTPESIQDLPMIDAVLMP